MKIIVGVLLLIAMLISGLVWHEHGRLAELEEKKRQVALAAAKQGASLDPAGSGNVIVTRRPREPLPPPVRFSVDETMEILRRMNQAQSQNQPVSPEDREAFADIVKQAGKLKFTQLRLMVEAISSCDEIPILQRKRWASAFIGAISEDRPQDILNLCMHLPVIMKGHGNGSDVFRRTLQNWTQGDMANAVPWILQNARNRPDLFNDDAINIVLSSVAKQDRRLAFSLISDLAETRRKYATQAIMGSARTAEERLDAIVALREYLPTIKKSGERTDASILAFAALGRRMAKEGFNSTSQWLDNKAELSETELANFGSDFGMEVSPAEAAQWMEYYGARLTGNRAERPVRGIMRTWTHKDFVAAGQWLASAQAGPMKDYATSVYAEEVVKLEPETAASWAEKLPPGDLRMQTLLRVYCHWPKGDEASKAAAADFAQRHGLLEPETR